MSGRVSLSRRDAEGLLDLLGHFYSPPAGSSDAQVIDRLRSALTPSPKKRAAKVARKAAKGAKRATKRERTSAIYDAVAKRADGKCEACGLVFSWENRAEMDHFFGRGKVAQSEANCWLICWACHLRKTRNLPSAKAWLDRFVTHARFHRYTASAAMALARLASLSDVAEAAALSRREG